MAWKRSSALEGSVTVEADQDDIIPLNDHSVLVVDDDDVIRMLIVYLLESHGYHVESARDGQQALDLLDEQRFDAVMLDVVMPGLGGLDVLLALRARFTRFELPVLMITSRSDSSDVIQALKQGANDYITKPIHDFDVVLARLENHLQFRAQAREISQHEPPPASQDEADPPAPGSSSKPAKARLPYYCAQCLSAFGDDVAHCQTCSSLRPTEGWPDLNTSPYRFLGKTIGRYVFVRLLGRGSVGTVYDVLDSNLGRHYALKAVEQFQPAQPNAGPLRTVDDVHRELGIEIEAMVQLTNPHVVKVYEALRLDDTHMGIVMELVRGDSLAHFLEDHGNLEPRLVLEIMRQLAEGLHEAHTIGLVHRDIKPDNVMLERLPMGGAFVKLLDFSIAHVLGSPVGSDHFYGTPMYAAPEQIMGWDSIDCRADIYAMGVMLYHLLTGEPPYMSHDVRLILKDHLYAPVPSIGAFVADAKLRDAIDGLIQRMMAKTVEARSQSLEEVFQHIEAIQDLM